MQTLLLPRFLLPAWTYYHLEQLRWLHNAPGVLNGREEYARRGETNYGKPSFRKQFYPDRVPLPGSGETRSPGNLTRRVLHKRRSARLETQNQAEVRKEDTACSSRLGRTDARCAGYSRQDSAAMAITKRLSNKQQRSGGYGAKFLTSHLRMKNASGLSQPKTTKLIREISNSGSRDPNFVADTHFNLQTAGVVSSPKLGDNLDQNSDIIIGQKENQIGNDSKAWGWMSSEHNRKHNKALQDVSFEFTMQPKFDMDLKVERRQMTTNVSSESFRRSDIPPLITSNRVPGSHERGTDNATLPDRPLGRTNDEVERDLRSQRANLSHLPSDIPKDRSQKSKIEVDVDQDTLRGNIRLRDKTSLRTPTAAGDLIDMPVQKELSLLEQLFPEEAKIQSRASENSGKIQEELPRLPPPDLDELYESLEDNPGQTQLSTKLKTREATNNALRQQNTTILLLSRVSTSLCDADFRRIVPRGIHIEEWRGPGDILKVIPSRDLSSLSPTSNYYLLFSNPAYARAYQNQVIHLHQLAQTYTPTSLDFPIRPAPGVLDTKGQDVYALLQDYTISPPSARMSLRVSIPPYHANLQRILQHEGYPQLVQSGDKAGRAVLFWVDGYQPSALSLKTMLAKDGQDRNLQWGPLRGKGEIEVLQVHGEVNGEENEPNDPSAYADETGLSGWGDIDLKPKRHGYHRWIISFEDEAEARRFVRLWHRRPYPFPMQEENPSQGEPDPLVHAEFMW